MFHNRTDIAAEALSRQKTGIPGLSRQEYLLHGLRADEVTVSSPEAVRLLKKPAGTYTVLDISSLFDPAQNTLRACSAAIADIVGKLLPPDVKDKGILAVGLGNRDITSDSVGPLTADSIIATRHLRKNLSEEFSSLTSVAVTAPGVLGSTGLESAETVMSLARHISPALCVVIDALAASDHNGLCKSVQISDTGITPGSGVGNHRFEISPKTLGIPCIAVGVPTVVDSRTLASGLIQKHGISEENFTFDAEEDSFFVTPKDIDSLSRKCAVAISAGLNLAFQPTLSYDDISGLLS
ncbi:MAG: GPR endopeptidase [Clostridia bacterium]|nr:GPR endopeptidase [Clostridia bacterium]